MENLSNIIAHFQHPLAIPVSEALLDHRFRGKSVLPAVIAMEYCAKAVHHYYPDRDISVIENARFNRFLQFDETMTSINAMIDITVDSDENIHCALVTSSRSKSASIIRRLVHAEISFPKNCPEYSNTPMDVLVAVEGACFTVPYETIYSELVTFGPAFHNIKEDLLLTRDGAIGLVYGGPDSSPMLLGSPYPADASFHCACIWGQRYMNVVSFPVAFSHRILYNPVLCGELYYVRIVPVISENTISFNAFILDAEGDIREVFFGLLMKDVSRGALLPPRWLVDDRSNGGEDLAINGLCHSLIELNAVLPCSRKVFTEAEASRYPSMHIKRKRSYSAGRIALKRLSRKITGNRFSPSETIDTVHEDSTPACPGNRNGDSVYCSMSHDSRFAIAVIDTSPIGIDVEEKSERLLKGHSLFMNENERSMICEYADGSLEASLRVWTTKEAAAKAFGFSLVEAWQKTIMRRIGTIESIFSIGEKNYIASHENIDNHLFTLVRKTNVSR